VRRGNGPRDGGQYPVASSRRPAAKR